MLTLTCIKHVLYKIEDGANPRALFEPCAAGPRAARRPDMRIPTLRTRILLESDPLISRILVGRLGVSGMFA